MIDKTKQEKPLARLTNHKNEHFDIYSWNQRIDFVMLCQNNELTNKNTMIIIPIELPGNEENGQKVICSIEKEQENASLDDEKNIKPFIFYSHLGELFTVNNVAIKRSQKMILLDNDVIRLKQNPNVCFKFSDLRQQIRTNFPSDVVNEYFIEKIIGCGVSGNTFLVRNVISFGKFALKQVEKTKRETRYNLTASEAQIMKTLNHPNIVQLQNSVDKPNCTYIFTDFLNCQDLLCLINSKPYGRFEELEARIYFAQIVDGLKYLHDLNICHRDIKCDNIFVHKQNNQYICKIGDFGLSAYDEGLMQGCGTLLYSPPEMLVKDRKFPYKGKRCDIWSLGVVLYCMISGKFTFHECFSRQLGSVEEQIKRGVVRFRSDAVWMKVSYDLKRLICCMICVNPFLRYTIDEVLQHPFMVNYKLTKINSRKRSIDEQTVSTLSRLTDISVKRLKINA